MSRFLKVCAILSAAVMGILLTGCPPSGGGGTSHALSGKVLDSCTGAPIAGATVDYAGYSATTGADGSFSIDFGTGTGTVSGDLCLHGTGYMTQHVTGCSCDKSLETVITVLLSPVDASGYAQHDVHGRIYEKQTDPMNPTEIATGSQLVIYVLNKDGGRGSGGQYTYDRTQLYPYGTVTTAFGSDCLVAAWVIPSGGGLSPFNVAVKADLSSSSTELDLTQDLANTTAVTVNGAAGNQGQANLVSPYGTFFAGMVTFSSSSAVLNVTNPYGYSGLWLHSSMLSDTPSSGYNKMFMSASGIAAIATPVTLPAINTSLGPTAIADPATLAYASGTLSVSPAAGAVFHQFSLRDNASGETVAMLTSSTASVALPSWLRSQLSGKDIRVGITPGDISIAWDVAAVAEALSSNGVMPGSSMAIVNSATGNNWKDFTF